MLRLTTVVVVAGLAGCTNAVTLQITSDRPIPQALDAICVGVADTSLHGGQFGRPYRLAGKLQTLPQTLRLEAGGASSALAWVRGDRGGVPVELVEAHLDFGSDVTLALDACVKGPAALPTQQGGAVGPGGARLAASEGAGGNVVVAVAAGTTSVVVDARSGALTTAAAPQPTGNPVAVIAADLDGDCDDDIVVATDAAPPTIWRREGASFTVFGTIGTVPVAAIAAADVDRNGTVDLVVGSGGTLELWRNDGGGNFTRDAAALSGGGRVSAISALALGDVDGDGNPDLIVGQAGAPLAAWLGDAGGTFVADAAVVPAVSLEVERLTLADADGDFAPDLAVAVKGAAMRLYIDRGGRLEDQSFVRLPAPIPIAHAVAVGNWDDGCEPDAVIASDAGAPTLRGQPGGMFAAETSLAPAATDVVMVDLDDDGTLDAVLATPKGVVWLAR